MYTTKLTAMYNVNITRTNELERIHIHEYFEVEYWTDTLGVSGRELVRAISEVGDSVDSVKDYLKNMQNEPGEIRRQTGFYQNIRA